jgi:hypothetical protein
MRTKTLAPAALAATAPLASPIGGARAEELNTLRSMANPVWMFAQQYIAESEALHFCLSRYDSSVRDDTYMPAATKEKYACRNQGEGSKLCFL